MKKTLVILILFGFLLPYFSFAQVTPTTVPENMEQAKELGQKALETTQKEMPGLIKNIFQNEVLPLWQKMYNWFKENIWPKVKDWFMKFIQPEIEKRKPGIQEEFQKKKIETKEQLQTEVPKIGQSLWEKFKELISTQSTSTK